jgi:hypothetical protein
MYSAKWGKTFLETIIKMEIPKDINMPDKEPIDNWESSVPDSDVGEIAP